MGYYDQVTTAKTGSFAARVYGWMTLGLATTAAVAFLLIQTGLWYVLMPYWLLWAIGIVGLGLAINTCVARCSIQTLVTLFLGYAVVEGIVFGTLLPAFAAAYGGSIIWIAFISAAVIFGSAALYGSLTKSDLTGIGRILMLGLIGLFALTLVYVIGSLFVSLPGLYLLISYVGLILFVALTATHAQQIRRASAQADNTVIAYKLAIMMALNMYINVIMIFWYLLQILSLGRRR